MRKLFLLDTATRLEDLRVPPGNRLEALGVDQCGQHSIRINEQWRLCFVWRDGDPYGVEVRGLLTEEQPVSRDIPLPNPGIVLKKEFLGPMGLSVYALAKAIHVTRSRVHDICLGRQGITAAMALRLGRFFGVDPAWFMNMQSKYDLHVQAERLKAELAAIEPRHAA